jgi:exosortase/archaeosortase family protein
MLRLKAQLNEVPVFVRRFMQRALVIFMAWKLLYHLILVPTKFPDYQLSQLTAHSTGTAYQYMFGQKVSYQEQNTSTIPKIYLYMDGQRGIGIADGCNGLELYILYMGFIFCLPTTVKRQLAFIAAGILGIYLLNNMRCIALAWMYLQGYPTDFAHHYVFKAIIYVLIFATWVKYSKKHYLNG